MVFRTAIMAGLISTLALTTMGANEEGCDPEQNGVNGEVASAPEDVADGWASGEVDPGNDASPSDPVDTATPAEPVDVPTDLAADLTFLREEEKLARDVYRTLGAQWGVRVFSNISASEETHMARALQRLVELGLPDPVVDDSTGTFVDQTLAELYVALTTHGQASLLAALDVGATIEDLDIKDLANMRTRTQDPATLAVYDDLMCGSRNHLRAFVGQLTSRGATYAAQYLTQAEVDGIVATPQERCGGR